MVLCLSVDDYCPEPPEEDTVHVSQVKSSQVETSRVESRVCYHLSVEYNVPVRDDAEDDKTMDAGSSMSIACSDAQLLMH